ncbi:hypothetical protein [Microvirga sp. 2TAF3]|uniref:hypothetical protein n=1 Tax=Microvirga sp. 2TAF3 TaxID=3233014 RepID=UPI003F9D78CD
MAFASCPFPDSIAIDEKVQFLRRPAAYPHRPREVLVKETHMSWVFLVGEQVFKLKKPVRSPQLDFSTLAAREANSQEEVRLNARLAPNTYHGVVALKRTPEGHLTLDGEGEIVDWLVSMRRLPDSRMLDRMLTRGLVTDRDLDRLADVLASFYAHAERAAITPDTYADRFVREQATNRAVLTCRAFAVDHGCVPVILDRLEHALAEDRALLEERVRFGQVVDGHGDLKPEHICLTDPIAIFDCLEFNRELRQADPFDELAFLGMECALLGHSWIGPALMDLVGGRLGVRPPDRLVRLYVAFRAVLRARLTLAHLLDPIPREPAKWEPLAARYLRLAEDALAEE